MKATMCEACGGPSEVLWSRETAEGVHSRRRRCLDESCQYRWTTFETADPPLPVMKPTG